MAYGIFDRADDNYMVKGGFPAEFEATAFLIREYYEEEGYEALYVDKVCPKHRDDQPEQECDCWRDGPYSDDRGDFGPGTGGYSAFI